MSSSPVQAGPTVYSKKKTFPLATQKNCATIVKLPLKQKQPSDDDVALKTEKKQSHYLRCE
jgi:hypothetical protein